MARGLHPQCPTRHSQGLGELQGSLVLPATRGRLPRAEAAHGAGCAPTVGLESPPCPSGTCSPQDPAAAISEASSPR